jgi:CubicO group peptidase (beta-lactamase class C family)
MRLESGDGPRLVANAAGGPWVDLLAYYPAWLAYRRWYLRIPGVQVALRGDGDLMLSQSFGVSNLETGEPLTPRHLFRIASHSKTFTAVAILRLVEGGALRLDDALATHLPELAGTALAGRTVGELLTHSGGVIRDSEDGDFWQLYRPFPNRDELLAIASRPSAAVLDRNDHFKYSNIAFGLLGQVIEAVTGQSFAEYVRVAIAHPLGLEDTGAELDPSRADDYAAGHSSLLTTRTRQTIAHVDTQALAAATGCYATANDLTEFFSALLPGDARLLNADSQRQQRHRHWDIKAGEQGYGLGVFLDKIADTELFGHTGGYPGHITCTYANPADRWVLSVLTNAIDGAASLLAAGYVHLLSLGRSADHAITEPDATKFTGRFAWLWGLLDVVRIDGRLFAISPTGPNPAEDAAPLEVVDDSTLKIVGGRGGNSYGELMTYEFDDDGSVRTVRGNSAMSMTPFRLPADNAA